MVNVDEKELLAERLASRNLYKLKQLTQLVQPEELAELINTSKSIDFSRVFQVLEAEKAVKTFEHLDFDIQVDSGQGRLFVQQPLLVESPTKITFKVGGSTITMEPGQITLVSARIDHNP